MKKYYIRLDAQRPVDTEYIQVIKQDTLSNVFYCTLTSNGSLIPMNDFTYVEVAINKPDASEWISSAEVLGNGQIKFDLEYQAIAAIGIAAVTLKLFLDDSILTMPAFHMNVVEDPNTGTDGSVESASEYPILSDMASNETGRLEAEAGRVAAEETRVLQETARETAEGIRDTSETARINAEDLRDSAETTRELQEDGRVSAEGNRVIAENARDSAETARSDAEDIRDAQESSRATAEGQRVVAEGLREYAESARVTAETGRSNAESTRVSQEEARVTAEGLRAAAETQRESDYVTAENNRDSQYDTAETARDSLYSTAESSRDAQYSSAEDARDALYNTAEGDRDDQYAIAEAARDVKMGELANLTTTEKSSIVGAVNELDSGKEPADATILKEADIGVNVQAYDANIVTDSDYVHTDNNYTDAEKAKMVNVPDDTNAQLAEIVQLLDAITITENTPWEGI